MRGIVPSARCINTEFFEAGFARRLWRGTFPFAGGRSIWKLCRPRRTRFSENMTLRPSRRPIRTALHVSKTRTPGKMTATRPQRNVRRPPAEISAASRRRSGRENLYFPYPVRWERCGLERRQIHPATLRRATVGEILTYTVCGNGFLHHMVRNLVGTFVEVGRGRLAAAEMSRILESRNRAQAGPTAVASGLCLMKVLY